MKKKSIVVIASVLTAGALAVLWLRPAPVVVDLGNAEKGAVVVTVDEEGKTRVKERYTVCAPFSGRISRIDVHEGDDVAEGGVVAHVMPLPLDARTRAELAARVESVRAAERAAVARVAQAVAAAEQAKRARVRAQQLAGGGVLPSREREEAELAETVRARELDSARLAARAAAYDLAAARAALLAAESGAAETATSVRSPAAGRVLKVIDESERAVAAGAPLLEVGDSRQLEIVLDVLSRDAVRIHPGAPMRIEEWGGAEPLAGTVRLVEPSAFTKLSALGVEEQRVHVVGDVRDAPGTLGDGFRVEARIVVAESKDTLRVPASALFRQGDAWAVFTVAKGRARLRAVRTGLQNPSHAEVVAGLSAGEPVVLHPGDRVGDGTRVRARR